MQVMSLRTSDLNPELLRRALAALRRIRETNPSKDIDETIKLIREALKEINDKLTKEST